MTDDYLHIGYGHASLIDALRPDVAYPDRKVRAGKKVISEILAEPCPCNDAHVHVYVRPVTRRLRRNR